MITQLIDTIETLIPKYAANPEDSFANGNVAVCIIDQQGRIYGKIWGNNKITGRNFFRNAWIKASQAWITGIKTGEFEKLLFNGLVKEEDFGIQAPDLIGWEGGLPIKLKNNTEIYVGFSGFRGFNDVKIIEEAVDMLNL